MKPANLNTISFDQLIVEARNGSEAAVKVIVERYEPYILRVIRRRMRREIRQKFDSRDFLQAVWASFFKNRDHLSRATDHYQLIGLLVAMARHKLMDETRKRLDTAKYDVKRECNIDDDRVEDSDVRVRNYDTPSRVAIAHETFHRMMDGESERDQEIVALRVAGEKVCEIAARLKIDERTVRRVLLRLENESGGSL